MALMHYKFGNYRRTIIKDFSFDNLSKKKRKDFSFDKRHTPLGKHPRHWGFDIWMRQKGEQGTKWRLRFLKAF